MTITHDRAGGAPLFIELRPGMRKALADAVEAFLNLLDQFDADADIEDGDPLEDDAPYEDVGDDEPSLGAPGAAFHPNQSHWSQGAGDDCEDEHDGREPDVDDEPSLGSSTLHIQTHWALGGDEDRELDEAERSGCGDMDGVYEQHGFGVQCAE